MIQIYLDNDLMVREEKEYLSRIKSIPEEYNINEFK